MKIQTLALKIHPINFYVNACICWINMLCMIGISHCFCCCSELHQSCPLCVCLKYSWHFPIFSVLFSPSIPSFRRKYVHHFLKKLFLIWFQNLCTKSWERNFNLKISGVVPTGLLSAIRVFWMISISNLTMKYTLNSNYLLNIPLKNNVLQALLWAINVLPGHQVVYEREIQGHKTW